MLLGAWVAQSVKHPSLGFSSVRDLTVHEFEPHIRLCTESAETAWDFLFYMHLLTLSVSQKINIKIFFFKNYDTCRDLKWKSYYSHALLRAVC